MKQAWIYWNEEKKEWFVYLWKGQWVFYKAYKYISDMKSIIADLKKDGYVFV